MLTAHLDTVAYEQILDNLITNVIKYTHHGTVTVRLNGTNMASADSTYGTDGAGDIETGDSPGVHNSAPDAPESAGFETSATGFTLVVQDPESG